MTAFTVNAGGTVEWDSLSGGSVNATLDSYTISNRTTLRIAVDTYQCANHSVAFGSLDTTTFSGTGGKVRLDGTQVRVLPFNTGSGTVPAIGTTISQGGVSGPLLGIWANWQSEPLAAGAAMPATGYIKLKSVTGGAFAAGALIGISASATGPDVVGWIEVRGADTSSHILLRAGTFEAEGAWFELGTTSGSRGQVLQCPTTATVAGVFPGVWIETGPGTGVYERFPCVGTKPASATTPTDERGKFVWQTTAGIVIGNDGTNNVGFLPPSGSRVRIPNIFMTCCTRTAGSGSGPRVLPNATLATRAEFNTGNAGTISLKNVACLWYTVFSQAYSLTLWDSCFSSTLLITETATPIDVRNFIVSPAQAQAQIPLDIQSSFYGGDVVDGTLVRATYGANGTIYNLASVQNLNTLRVRGLAAVDRTGTSPLVVNISGASGSLYFEDLEAIGARIAVGSGAIGVTFKDTRYADRLEGTTNSTNALDLFVLTNCADATMDGLDFFGLANAHPYGNLLNFTGTLRTKMRNVGSPTARLDLGSANQTARLFTSGGGNRAFKLQRIYAQNTRTDQWNLSNFDIGGLIEHVWADALDSATVPANETEVKATLGLNNLSAMAATYGQHWLFYLTSAVSGRLIIMGNEPLESTATQCFVSGGTPFFEGQGQVQLTSVGDEMTWVTPYWVKGVTNFNASGDPVLTGTNTGNLAYEFQIDTGSGWNGTWLTLNSTNLTSFDAALSPEQGFKIMIRARCVTAAGTNALRAIRITFDMELGFWEDPNNLYPLDTNTITFTGLPTGTDIVVLTAGTDTILAQQDSNPTSSYGYAFSGAQTVDVGFIKQGYVPLYIRNLALTTVDSSIPVAMTPDRNFI